MRRSGFALPLLLAACATPQPAPPPAAAPPVDTTALTATLLQLEQDWCEARRNGNAATVARIEDESFARTDAAGLVSHRADDLGEIEQRTKEYSRLENREQQVQLRGDSAIVTGISLLEGYAGDKPFKLAVRFTDTFVRRAGAWRAVTEQLTPLDRPA